MSNRLLNSLELKGFLSFGPGSEPVELTSLNVLIGPNGVGKSNFIEALELLHATPTDLPAAIRAGGRPMDWIWRGESPASVATIGARIEPKGDVRELIYRLAFTETGHRVEIVDEVLEEASKTDPTQSDVRFFYRFQDGRPAINVRQFSDAFDGGFAGTGRTERRLQRESISPEHPGYASTTRCVLAELSRASACSFNPRAPITFRMVSKPGLRSPESAL